MKLKAFLSIASACLPMLAFSQITITENDMPAAGNTFINTIAATDVFIDLSITGTNQNWNYVGGLIPLYSVGDTVIDANDLSLAYQLYFFNSDLADQNGIAVDFNGFTLEDLYTVYSTSSSEFDIDGYAGTFSGIPLALKYSSKDVLYNFPMNYLDKDSSDAEVNFYLPGVVYFSQKRHRVNEVDGWGTMKTPIGIFDALRLKSTITDVDSIYFDALGYGYTVTPKSYEYRWLSLNEGLPVFQVNAQDVLGEPAVTQIIYQDTAFQVVGIEDPEEAINLKVFPNPADDVLNLQLADSKPATIEVYDCLGKRMLQLHLSQNTVSLSVKDFPEGIFYAQIYGDETVYLNKFVVKHR